MAAVGVVGVGAGVRGRASGVAVEFSMREPQAPGTHIAKHCGWRGLRRLWWCERLAGGAPVAPPRRIRRGAWQEQCPVLEVVKKKSDGC